MWHCEFKAESQEHIFHSVLDMLYCATVIVKADLIRKAHVVTAVCMLW